MALGAAQSASVIKYNSRQLAIILAKAIAGSARRGRFLANRTREWPL